MRRVLPLVASLILVLGTGAVGLAVAHDAQKQTEGVHIEDRVRLQDNLAALARQYLLFAAQELFSTASSGDWSLTPGDAGDEQRLESLVSTSQLFNHGAALLSLDRRPLTVFAREPGLPPADHPGYQPVATALVQEEPGFSSVMAVDGESVVAVAVPIVTPGESAEPRNPRPRALLLGFFRADATPLQTYVEGLRFGDTGKGYVLDAQGTVVAARDAELIGTRRPELQAGIAPDDDGATFTQIERPDGDAAVSAAPIGVAGWTVATEQDAGEFFSVMRRGGELFRLVLIAVLALAAGGLTFLNHRRLAALRKAAHRVLHDGLTELPNRTYFRQRLEAALARSQRDTASMPPGVAVLFIDVDHFKVINDSLGHRTGDELLVEVGKRLHRTAPDRAMVARLGGDEFTILLEETTDIGEAEDLAEDILRAFIEPVAVEGHSLAVTVSVGLAVSPVGETSGEDLLRDADLAMYRAKERGRACYARFEPELADEAIRRLQLEADLRRALERGEIEVHYQPLVDLVGGAVVGLEALARWRRSDGRLERADQFIPVAESSGLVVPLGRQVLEDACRQAGRWEAEHGIPITISVNISPVQLRPGKGIVADVGRVLTETRLPPEQLTLEVTEQVMLDEEAVETLREVRSMGVGLAIDDFGAGYSSLSHLRRLPVTELKLDHALVQSVGTDAEADILVSALLSLARQLGIVVTAEGVEEGAQVDRLRELGCLRGQGYLLYEPAPSEVVTELLARPGPLVSAAVPTARTVPIPAVPQPTGASARGALDAPGTDGPPPR